MLSVYASLLDFAISIYWVVTVVFLLIFFILFLFCGVYLYTKVRNRRKISARDWLGLSCISGVFVIFLLLKIFVSIIPAVFANELFSREGVKANINGRDINVSMIRSGLSNYIVKESGSSPEYYLDLGIEYKEYKLEFVFGADTKWKDVYWIYFPDYGYKVLMYIAIFDGLDEKVHEYQ